MIGRIAFTVLLPVALAGCGLGIFSDRATNPAIEDDITGRRGRPQGIMEAITGRSKTVGILHLNAGRRLVISPADPDPVTSRHFVCAEPPPDALEAVSNSLRVAASATGEAPARAEFERAFAVSSGALLYRSQGLQMLRDGMSHLCMMRMNGAINDRQYLAELQALRNLAAPIIMAEIPAITAAAARAPVTVVAPPNSWRPPDR